MQTLSELEFAKIVDDIIAESDVIIRHNPVGTEDEILLWMLMNCLTSYLSISDAEAPCFAGVPNAETYSQAVTYILTNRKLPFFDETPYLERLVKI